MFDQESGAGMEEDTLSLRVTRSGTKLPAPVGSPWQAKVCRSCLEAKDLPKELRRGLPQGLLPSQPHFPGHRYVFYEFRFSICSLFYFTTVFYLKSSVVESVCRFELFLLTPVGSIYRGFWCRYGLILPLGGFLRGASRCPGSHLWCGSRLVPGRRTAARRLFRTGDIFYR